MKIVNWLFAFLCLNAISGCAFSQKLGNLPSTQIAIVGEKTRPTDTNIDSIAATQIVTPILGPVINTPITPTKIQPTETVTKQAMRTCKNNGIPQKVQEGFGLSGSIVFQEEVVKNYQIIAASGKPVTYVPLPVPDDKKYFEMLGFSPNGQWLAYASMYTDADKDDFQPAISLISDRGKILERKLDLSQYQDRIMEGIRWIGVRSFSLQWLNDQYIHLSILSQATSGSMKIFPVDALYDPVNNRWNLELYKNIPKERASENVGFSPDLTRGIYLLSTGAMLVNLPDGDTIWQLKHQFEYGSLPLFSWKDDSSQFAFASQQEALDSILIVDRDGKNENQVALPDGLDRIDNYSIEDIHWSPDGNYLAISIQFLRSGEQVYKSEFFIYDVTLKKYIYSCPIDIFKFSTRLEWSPDSRYILPYSPGATGPLILYDLYEPGEVIQLKDIVSLGGWSKSYDVLRK